MQLTVDDRSQSSNWRLARHRRRPGLEKGFAIFQLSREESKCAGVTQRRLTQLDNLVPGSPVGGGEAD